MSGRIRKAFIPLLVVVMVALAVPMSAGAAGVGAQSLWSKWMTSRAIAENPPLVLMGWSLEWSTPAISGNWAVYAERYVDADGPGAGTTPGDWDIEAYNLVTGETVSVDSSDGDQYWPKISGSWVVYQDESNGTSNSDILAYNLSTRTAREVTVNLDDVQSPDVSGSIAVWANATDGDVEWADLSNTDRAGSFALDAEAPSISGDRLAFVRSGQVMYKDLTTGLESTVHANYNSASPPRIDGSYIVFGDSDGDIWVYDAAAASPAAVEIATVGSCFAADVHGTIAVWETYDADEPYLQAYDFKTGKVVTLDDRSPKHLVMPAIWGNRVVFVSADDSFIYSTGSIEYGTIAAPVIGLSGATTISYGAKPGFTGVMTENGTPLGNKTVFIDKSTNGGHTWSQVATLTTSGSGAFSYTGSAIYRKAVFRARFNGEVDGFFLSTYQSRFSMVSSSRNITPKALVGKPAGYPASARKNKTYSTYGSLKPRQPVPDEDDWIMHIKAYHRENGKWVLRKTILADVYNYSSYSRYRGSLKLTRSGRWRIRGHFDGSATNASAVGPYKYVYVY